MQLGFDQPPAIARNLVTLAAPVKVELRIHPEAEWSILSFLDLETVQRTG